MEHLQDLHGLLFLEWVLVQLVGRVVQFHYVVLELLEADALVAIDIEFVENVEYLMVSGLLGLVDGLDKSPEVLQTQLSPAMLVQGVEQ